MKFFDFVTFIVCLSALIGITWNAGHCLVALADGDTLAGVLFGLSTFVQAFFVYAHNARGRGARDVGQG
jgi:hypothetical protein